MLSLFKEAKACMGIDRGHQHLYSEDYRPIKGFLKHQDRHCKEGRGTCLALLRLYRLMLFRQEIQIEGFNRTRKLFETVGMLLLIKHSRILWAMKLDQNRE